MNSKNTINNKIPHKIQGNIFLPPYRRFFFLKNRFPINDVEKIINIEHNGRITMCSTPSSQRITPCPPGVRQISNSNRTRYGPPINFSFLGCQRTEGLERFDIHPSNNSGSAKRSYNSIPIITIETITPIQRSMAEFLLSIKLVNIQHTLASAAAIKRLDKI